MKRGNYITLIIILIIVAFSGWILLRNHNPSNGELAKCIGENSRLYVQLGCIACKHQEDLFGENYKYINAIDCFYERDKCIQLGIEATPTWIIKGNKIEGVQTIKKLKELTGC